jgi:hypothetical protein
MEHMKANDQIEAQLWKVAAQEKLTDFHRFHDALMCDEFPLYSRGAQVETVS